MIWRIFILKITIECDSEKTFRYVQYLIEHGMATCDKDNLKILDIDTSLDVNYSVIQRTSPKIYLYGARDTTSGKLVSNLVNPRRKYWDREANATAAINNHNTSVSRYGSRYGRGKCELVKFELVEVVDKND